MTTQKPPTIHIPKGWPSHVKSAVLHIISLAHFSITHARGWAANSGSERVRRSFGVGPRFVAEIQQLTTVSGPKKWP